MKTSLKDMVSTKCILEKAGLLNLNETAAMVWKSQKAKDTYQFFITNAPLVSYTKEVLQKHLLGYTYLVIKIRLGEYKIHYNMFFYNK